MSTCHFCDKVGDRFPWANHCCDECHDRDFWENDVFGDSNTIVVDGTAYTIGDENSKSSFRGFGGSKFKIKKSDGTIIESTNLWYRGEVPERYKEEHPNDAEFIR